MIDPSRFPPASQKLNAAGVAAIPPAASTAPEPPPPPSGTSSPKPSKVSWLAIREALLRHDAKDLYDQVGGRYGWTDPWLVREFATRIRALHVDGRQERRDALASDLEQMADRTERQHLATVLHDIADRAETARTRGGSGSMWTALGVIAATARQAVSR
jgi:hypothetical protein